MIRSRWSTIALALMVATGCAHMRSSVQPQWLDRNNPRIAVLPFEIVDDSYETNLGTEMANALINELVDRGFSVVERTQLSQLLKEHRLQYTGLADPATLIKTGRMNGVDYMVVGALKTRPRMSVYEYFLGDGNKTWEIDSVWIRWVNVENGRVVASSVFKNPRGDKSDRIARLVIKALERKIDTIGYVDAKKMDTSSRESQVWVP